ncbi:MAG TPA: hypothetical protein VNQ73_13625 [Ilumatobacter sp.]|nr:hypothetical protein [Ilumatobacter sp.]
MAHPTWFALALAIPMTGAGCVGPLDRDAAPCDGVRAGDVEAFFATPGNPLFGGDYQRAHRLDDERTLWTFQDATLLDAAHEQVFTHNAAALQTGECWTVLNAADGLPWLLADQTELEHRWFWPLGGAMSADGATFGLFLAELVERGEHYLDHPEPVGVVLATLDAATLDVVDIAPAPAGGPEIYGWSVTSDTDSTYLYSWCLRQWGWSDTGHDPACTGDVLLARVPRGELTAAPQFWDGAEFQPDPAGAVSVFDRSHGDVRPTEVLYDADRSVFVAVSKPGDWYGDTVYVDRSPDPFGPWTTTDTITVAPKCAPEHCNTYFASFAAGGREGDYQIAISHNRWDGDGLDDPVVYRPTVFTVSADANLDTGEPTATTILTYPDPRE